MPIDPKIVAKYAGKKLKAEKPPWEQLSAKELAAVHVEKQGWMPGEAEAKGFDFSWKKSIPSAADSTTLGIKPTAYQELLLKKRTAKEIEGKPLADLKTQRQTIEETLKYQIALAKRNKAQGKPLTPEQENLLKTSGKLDKKQVSLEDEKFKMVKEIASIDQALIKTKYDEKGNEIPDLSEDLVPYYQKRQEALIDSVHSINARQKQSLITNSAPRIQKIADEMLQSGQHDSTFVNQFLQEVVRQIQEEDQDPDNAMKNAYQILTNPLFK
jgi:polyhydroxyalkanoate synthesis regulator phasin